MQTWLVCFQVNILCFFVQFCDSLCYQRDKVLRMTKILIVTNIAADIIPLVNAGAGVEDRSYIQDTQDALKDLQLVL